MIKLLCYATILSDFMNYAIFYPAPKNRYSRFLRICI